MATKEKPPRCALCDFETEKVFLGRMNNLDIYICPKCDRVNKK
jgi:hypothetical protein